MSPIKKNSNNNYEIPETQFLEIQEAMHNIGVLLDIMYDYCDYNVENSKVYPLITMIEQLHLEKKKITEKF